MEENRNSVLLETYKTVYVKPACGLYAMEFEVEIAQGSVHVQNYGDGGIVAYLPEPCVSSLYSDAFSSVS